MTLGKNNMSIYLFVSIYKNIYIYIYIDKVTSNNLEPALACAVCMGWILNHDATLAGNA